MMNKRNDFKKERETSRKKEGSRLRELSKRMHDDGASPATAVKGNQKEYILPARSFSLISI